MVILLCFGANHPDQLFVISKIREVFKKLWENNTIWKSEFYSLVPVLVLSVKKD
ncbi:hypothetical protein KCTC52924_01468 [Arenibacter antarcticus]